MLGFVGFFVYGQWHDQNYSFSDLVYLTVQLFFLQSGAVAQPIPLALEIARILAPLLFFYAALRALYRLFWIEIRIFLLRFRKNFVVIGGLGYKGWLLAKRFRAQGKQVVVIERNGENELIADCRAHRIAVLVGNATDPAILKKVRVERAETLIAVTDNDAVNSEIAFWIKCSFSGSTLAVASSSIIIGASFRIALAMEMRCFSPPDRLPPPSPMTVS